MLARAIHLTWCVYDWFLPEMDCHKLYLTLAQHIKGNTDDKEGFRKYATLMHEPWRNLQSSSANTRSWLHYWIL